VGMDRGLATRHRVGGDHLAGALLPEGRFLSPGWRVVGIAIMTIAFGCSTLSALWPVEYVSAGIRMPPPVELGGLDVARDVWDAIAHPAYALFQLTWVVGLAARWR